MKVNFKISCKDLANLDTLSKSDPMAVVFENRGDVWWREIGRTEMVKNSLNPEFTTMVGMEYHFEMCQKIRFDVYDVDTAPTDPVEDQELVGSAEVLLSDIISEWRCHYTEKLTCKDKKDRGTIFVFCEEDKGNDDVVELKIKGENLDKKDLFGKSDPYFILYKKMPDGTYSKAYQSETIMKTLNPSWERFKMRTWDLCGEDISQEIKVECFDWDKHSSDDLIGEATFIIEKIEPSGAKKEVELINPKYKSKKKYKNSGKLVFEYVNVVKIHSFIEFLRSGFEINLMVAIDFTGSNGDPKTPSSLHYINPDGSDNSYMYAIRSIGSILAAYDKDQIIPVYGYGACFPRGGVNHCFPLNGNEDKPEVLGIDGVLKAYQETLQTVELWGPTHFAEIIKKASEITKEGMEKNPYKYYVLLILTDGVINDMEATIDGIVKAANDLPLSIVITGIGEADFSDMDKLDGDGSVLKSTTGVKAERDIVQFVPFNKYSENPQMLAQETLAEIPKQVSEYMAMKGIYPVNPQPDVSIPADENASAFV